MAMFSDVVKNFSESDFPKARLLDPASVPSLRWGIVGAGDIADVFINTLKKHTKQQVVGIASKTPGKAAALLQNMALIKHMTPMKNSVHKKISMLFTLQLCQILTLRIHSLR